MSVRRVERGLAIAGSGLLVSALLVAATPAAIATSGGPDPVEPVAAASESPPGKEKVAWGECPDGTPVPERGADLAAYECASLEVLLTYRQPEGKRFRLALGRLPAADRERKLGTLFYNPGGPGNPGRLPPVLTERLHERYDLVGFDPRGVAASAGIRCFEDPADQALMTGPFPIDREQERRKVADAAAAGALCERNAGPMLDHMSTANVARDLDRLRAALGEERTSYVGHSYGSHLGAVYANLFPHRVGAVVLDASPDPVAWTGRPPADPREPIAYRIGGHVSSQRALETFLAACATDTRCAFREPGTDLGAKYAALLDRTQDGPVEVPRPDGSTLPVTYQALVGQTFGALHDPADATELAAFLQAVHEHAHDPAATRRAAPPTPPTPPMAAATTADRAGGPYVGPEQGTAVCLDSLNPANPHVWWAYAKRSDRVAPGFGSLNTYKGLCAG